MNKQRTDRPIPTVREVIEKATNEESKRRRFACGIAFEGPKCPCQGLFQSIKDGLPYEGIEFRGENPFSYSWQTHGMTDLDSRYPPFLDALIKAAITQDREAGEQEWEEVECNYCRDGLQFYPTDQPGFPTKPCDSCSATGMLYRRRTAPTQDHSVSETAPESASPVGASTVEVSPIPTPEAVTTYEEVDCGWCGGKGHTYEGSASGNVPCELCNDGRVYRKVTG